MSATDDDLCCCDAGPVLLSVWLLLIDGLSDAGWS